MTSNPNHNTDSGVEMYKNDKNQNNSFIFDLVPGYASYARVSDRLAERFLEIIEYLINATERFRTNNKV